MVSTSPTATALSPQVSNRLKIRLKIRSYAFEENSARIAVLVDRRVKHHFDARTPGIGGGELRSAVERLQIARLQLLQLNDSLFSGRGPALKSSSGVECRCTEIP